MREYGPIVGDCDTVLAGREPVAELLAGGRRWMSGADVRAVGRPILSDRCDAGSLPVRESSGLGIADPGHPASDAIPVPVSGGIDHLPDFEPFGPTDADAEPEPVTFLRPGDRSVRRTDAHANPHASAPAADPDAADPAAADPDAAVRSGHGGVPLKSARQELTANPGQCGRSRARRHSSAFAARRWRHERAMVSPVLRDQQEHQLNWRYGPTTAREARRTAVLASNGPPGSIPQTNSTRPGGRAAGTA